MKKIIAVVLLLLSISCGGPEYMPPEIHSLKLVNKITGADAAAYVNKIHYGDVAGERNEIGFYSGKEGEATLYLTYYNSKEEAVQDEKKMTEKISPLNSVFINGSFIEINDKRFYRTFGMGQTHFIFSSSNVLIWFSAETVVAKKLLIRYLEYIN
ncbi:MAG: hypothetical protein JW995_08335 [Melioribacteraceae bacterium]|nr:hypothetical protein [Melioribacteraceae bacterium]